jgi:Flp pilus assembly pilin Flp
MFESVYNKVFLSLLDLRSAVRREDGQALVEYALIISLIAVVAIGALQATGTQVTSLLTTIAGDL